MWGNWGLLRVVDGECAEKKLNHRSTEAQRIQSANRSQTLSCWMVATSCGGRAGLAAFRAATALVAGQVVVAGGAVLAGFGGIPAQQAVNATRRQPRNRATYHNCRGACDCGELVDARVLRIDQGYREKGYDEKDASDRKPGDEEVGGRRGERECDGVSGFTVIQHGGLAGVQGWPHSGQRLVVLPVRLYEQ